MGIGDSPLVLGFNSSNFWFLLNFIYLLILAYIAFFIGLYFTLTLQVV